ncbi:MAG: hypothetical protein ACRDRL_12195 [Sciscionella sp.]
MTAPNYPQDPQYQPTATPVKKHRRWPWITGGIVGVFIVLGIVAAIASPSPKTADAAASIPTQQTVTPTVNAPKRVETKTVTAAPKTVVTTVTKVQTKTVTVHAAAPAPVAGASMTTDGTFVVGTDVKPGTYHTAGSADCYWEREKDTSGNFNSIIANNISAGPQTVTIAPSDGAFKTEGCGTWTRQ